MRHQSSRLGQRRGEISHYAMAVVGSKKICTKQNRSKILEDRNHRKTGGILP
jgi:hypothetical protein